MSDDALDLARANLYRYLSVAPLAPEDSRFELLRHRGFQKVVRAAVELLRTDPAFQPATLGPGETQPSLLEPVTLFPDGENVAELYAAAFGHSISKDCPPYETEHYPNRDISFRAQRLADVAGFYRAFGLDRAPDARERIDHLSFEAEFMEIAIARRLYAVDNGFVAERAEACRRAQRAFFVEHLGWWLSAFGIRLRKRSESPFYRSLGALVRALTAAERAILGVPPFTELPEARPDTYEPVGGCFSCGLNAAGGGFPSLQSGAGGERE